MLPASPLNTLGDLKFSYRGVNSIISDKDGYVSGF